MFSQYTWGDYFKVMGSLTVIYYIIIGLKFYREEIRNFFSRKPKDTDSQAATPEDEEEEDLSDLFKAKTYQGAPAFAGALAEPTAVVSAPVAVENKPQPTLENTSVQNPIEVVEPKVEEVTKQDPEKEPEPQEESILEGATVVEPSRDPDATFLMPFAGEVASQDEQDLQTVVETAQELEKQEDGQSAPKPTAGRRANLLAETINGQQRKSVADILKPKP